jgi:hypothetical protein
MNSLKYTTVKEGALGTLWSYHQEGVMTYVDGPWLLSSFHVGAKVRAGSKSERNGRNWYETPVVANIVGIKRINPAEVRITFNGLNGTMWAIDVAPEAVVNDETLADIVEAVATYKLDDLYFLNISYTKGELI